MDFFANQEAAKRKTKWLVCYFVLAVASIVLSVYGVVWGVVLYGRQNISQGDPLVPFSLWQTELFVAVAVCVLFIVLIGTFWKIATLRGGGASVATMLGGQLLMPDTRDFKERQLLNVVEEMAIAAGVAVPPVYVMKEEMSINAFAAGSRPEDAVIGVTRGTLELLDRNELQGVIAHEFSHILNGDMRLNLRLMGVIHGILVISMVGFWTMRISAHGENKSALPPLVIGAALCVIGYIGVFFGRIIKGAVSRQREFLADSSAVQFTRDPDGIGGALKKIGGASMHGRVRNAHAEEVSHMFFANSAKFNRMNLTASHPPLPQRIREIDPNWDGKFVVPEPPRPKKDPTAKKKDQKSGFDALPDIPGIDSDALGGLPAVLMGAADVVSRVGTLDDHHVDYARKLLAEMPEELKDHAREPYGARALIYALILHDGEGGERQRNRLEDFADQGVYELTLKLWEQVKELPARMRLPLVDMTLPAMGLLSQDQYKVFRENLYELIAADDVMDLFEYCIQRILHTNLDRQFGVADYPKEKVATLVGMLDEASVVMSLLARVGHDDEADAEKAFNIALAPMGAFRFMPDELCGLQQADDALEQLQHMTPQLKKKLLLAAAKCVGFDGKITVAEAELFRAIGESLYCPVPPLFASEDE